VIIKDGGAGTSVEGVFVAGDLHDREWCQAGGVLRSSTGPQTESMRLNEQSP
jgi:thioredoxin reductase